MVAHFHLDDKRVDMLVNTYEFFTATKVAVKNLPASWQALYALTHMQLNEIAYRTQ
jgi:hypothetical protein